MRGSIALLAWAACAIAAAPAPTHAATDDIARLRAELEALKTDYATRIATLEARITELETGGGSVPQAPEGTVASPPVASPPAASPSSDAALAATAPTPSAEAPSAPSRASAASAFNPAISLILGGSYSNLSQDPEDYAIAGFIPAGDEIGPGERSFNLGESELTLTASVDPYFSGALTVAITPENEVEVEVEEAFFRSLALPAGLTLKGGRFFSGFGYLNEIHGHAWDFVDQPLAYQAFFGGQRAQDGLQLKWIAPTDFFLELGAETGNGEAFPGTRRGANGLNGATLFAHVGGDFADAWAWRAGASWIELRAEDRAYEDTDALGNDVENAFTGTSRTWVADATLKWTSQGDPLRRYLKLQGEYLRRSEDGDLAFDVSGANLADRYRSTQDGWYLQGVYRFRPRWRAGLRYDSVDSGTPEIGLVESGALTGDDFPLLIPASPSRTTVMLDWSPSEFSRLRAQFAWDDARDAATDEQFFLQYIMALGAHGAHKF